MFSDAMYIIYAYRLVAVGSNFNVENDPTCSMAPRVVIKYKLHWDWVGVKF